MVPAVALNLALCAAAAQPSKASPLDEEIDRRAADLEARVIAWRRDLHAHPELSNREFRTSKVVAEHLRELGLEVRTGIAHTGVVGVLHGGRAGPVVALRADMDGLPVTEQADVPFASKVTTTYRGRETGVMHACGHDAHVAIAMGAAELLTGMRDELPGTVVFIFQPAEEGAPEGEEGGAELMLKEGLFDELEPDAIFGLHVWTSFTAGSIGYRAGPAMASYDNFRILVRGRQTHASKPWAGIDPIVTSAQIVLGLQTIASRQVDVTAAPSVISVGSIHGGIRNNIIPDEVEMLGTVRAYDPEMRLDILRRLEKTTTSIAESAGASADVIFDYGYPVTINDPALTSRMLPTLQRVAGADKVMESDLITAAEDFAYFQQQVPGFYFFLGVTPADRDAAAAPPNHSPFFYIDESALLTGLRAMSHLAVDYLHDQGE